MPEHSHSSGDYFGEDQLFLSGCFRHKYPQFTDNRIVFNGCHVPPKLRVKDSKGNWSAEGENEHDLSHETFSLQRKAWKSPSYRKNESTLFSFCKTARKPYDLMVQACLILYKYYFPYVKIASNGDAEDWESAFEFVSKHFPEKSLAVKVSGIFN